MKTSQFIGAVVLSILGVSAAQAETYQGVQTVNAVASRADVVADATVAAHTADIFGEAAYAGAAPVLDGGVDRTAVRTQAVQTARLGNLYGEQASSGVLSPKNGQVSRDTVRAEARAASRNASAAL